jgi:hypothetical protein
MDSFIFSHCGRARARFRVRLTVCRFIVRVRVSVHFSAMLKLEPRVRFRVSFKIIVCVRSRSIFSVMGSVSDRVRLG